ncbi:Ribonuclease H-like superfamily [Arabidopsis thaliana x Arabidopsis arenosa]|uniref:Ribonuclease H-like superfamily n=1 Tax=Arabidopsis thaliana x Arabidopsis arenosa TaxID=1240361 RepID=A0A8T2C3F2_9BRAS|nr:Ribonuclease H-like superfamily [Arabidopsis thaliana x Arabidopsis arenosa]
MICKVVILVANGRDWNLDLLSSLFTEETVKQIVQIRPGGRNSVDSFAWDYSVDGQYTVKSAYWVLMEVVKRKNQPQEVIQPNLNPIFQQIWKADSSPKVQHFLWRCVSNCISVAGNLHYRHLAKDGSCVRCPSQVETVNHLLFKCSFARLVWAISPIPAPQGTDWSDSIYQNMYCILNITQTHPHLGDEGSIGPWILWRLWKSRNDYIFKGKEYNALQVIKKAKEDVEEWRMRKEKQSQPPKAPKPETNKIKWVPPPLNWVKCNTDGAWSAASTNCGIGWVLRDQGKKVLWMGARALPKVNKVLEVEMEGLRWAVMSLVRFNYRKVIFETDSQQVVSLIRGVTSNNYLSPIIHDIQQLLQQLEDFKVVFTYREGNQVADRIAKESISFENYDPKLYSIPPMWVKTCVEEDNM